MGGQAEPGHRHTGRQQHAQLVKCCHQQYVREVDREYTYYSHKIPPCPAPRSASIQMPIPCKVKVPILKPKAVQNATALRLLELRRLLLLFTVLLPFTWLLRAFFLRLHLGQ